MRAVCNATPLIHLAKIGRLDLLQNAFESVSIPSAVQYEVVEQGGEGADVHLIREALFRGWLKVDPVPDRLDSLTVDLKSLLGLGEAEAIALACELHPDYLIIDERAGRKRAIHLGLKVTGTIGLLLNAKFEGWLDPLKPELDRLVQTGFRMDDELYRRTLRDAGEG